MLSQVRSGGIDYLTCPGVVLANLVPLASLNSVGFAFSDYPTVWKAMDGRTGAVHPLGDRASPTCSSWTRSGTTAFARSRRTSRSRRRRPRRISRSACRSVPSCCRSSSRSAPRPPRSTSTSCTARCRPRWSRRRRTRSPLINNSKLYEVQKNCALTGHVWDGYWFLANKRAFEGLPAALQEIVTKNFDAAGVAAAGRQREARGVVADGPRRQGPRLQQAVDRLVPQGVADRQVLLGVEDQVRRRGLGAARSRDRQARVTSRRPA